MYSLLLSFYIVGVLFCYVFVMIIVTHVGNLIVTYIGNIICENLPKDVCAFSISSTGKRCLIETSSREGGTIEYQCRASEVMVERMKDWIETDDCVRACGVDRNSVGISSDSLMESQFTTKLCSPACYQDCPNIIDLYFNLAAGEGKKRKEKTKENYMLFSSLILLYLLLLVWPFIAAQADHDFRFERHLRLFWSFHSWFGPL